MGFFSRGSSDDSSQPATRDFSSSDEAAYTHEDTMPTSPSAAGGGMAEMQQFAQAIQQQVIIQCEWFSENRFLLLVHLCEHSCPLSIDPDFILDSVH